MTDTKPLLIGVLETGVPPQELREEFGTYPEMVAAWLKPLNAEYRNYCALRGELPDDPQDCDLWVITGSRFGVYDGNDWIANLEDFIRDCRDQGRKMVGICFGHQLIAQALGGVVGKSGKGWGLGVHQYDTMNWPDELGAKPEGVALQVYHQDQIETPPDGARTIAANDFCQYAALWYPDFALTVQGHPEFGKSYSYALLESRRGVTLSDADVDAAIENMKQDADPGDLVRMVAVLAAKP